MVVSYYNANGNMVDKCAECGQVVAEWECDENGIPTVAIFDYSDEHICDDEE